MELIDSFLENKERNLASFISNTVTGISDYIGLDTCFMLSSEIPKNQAQSAQDRIITMCKTLEADTYINPIGGTDLYSKEDFNRNDIGLKFIKTRDIRYTQYDTSFIPNLSIIDVLMFNSPNNIKNLITEYDLI